jgi:hypothetical protein
MGISQANTQKPQKNAFRPPKRTAMREIFTHHA